MADQADVENALAALIANALYPNGTAALSAVGAVCKVYRGYPNAPALDEDLARGIVHVSIAPVAGAVRNVTRYPRQWQEVKPVAQVLDVIVQGVSASFAGGCAVGQLAGVLVNEQSFAYAVQASDSPATVASNLAALIRTAGWIVNYAGSGLSVPAARRFDARVVAGAGALQEIRRQVQEFGVTMWCADPVMRDAVAPVIDEVLGALKFIPLADGSFGHMNFTGTATQDGGAETSLFRREVIYAVEYPTTLAQMAPAMLFGTVTASADAVVLGNFQS